MKPSTLTTAACIVVCAFGIALPSYAGNTCEVKSGAATAALVELYTSECRSSYPSADKRLKQLQQVQKQRDADVLLVSVLSLRQCMQTKGF